MGKFGYCACDLGTDEIKKVRKKCEKHDDFKTITGGLI